MSRPEISARLLGLHCATSVFVIALGASPALARDASALIEHVRPADDATIAEKLKQLEAAMAAQGAKVDQLQQHVIQQGNWIGQLLYRTQDMVDRTKWEAEARLLAPEFTPQELALLDRWELNTDALKDAPKPTTFPTAPSAAMAKPKLLMPSGPQHRYGVGDAKNEVLVLPRKGIRVDPNLRLLDLKVHKATTQKPEIEAVPPWTSWFSRKHWNYHFEFDTVPTFDSAHFWRYPTLSPAVEGFDLTGARGVHYYVSMTTLTDHKPGRSVTFPFRASAMSLPLPADHASLTDFIKMARLLQSGLSKQDSIREVFDYVRHKYIWGGNTHQLNVLDTFRAGIAGCGDINELMSAMLEASDIRTRAVSGFNPTFRVWNPGGGHTAAEVFDGNQWSFIDTFLGVYFPGIAAQYFEKHPLGLHPAGVVSAPAHRDRNGLLAATFGATLTLRDLFKYRVYSDKEMRLPVAHMLRLRGAAARKEPYPTEQTYGLSWPLRTSDIKLDLERDLPETTTIYVRARYVVSSCQIKNYAEPPCIDPDATASEWTNTSFTIKPRELLK